MKKTLAIALVLVMVVSCMSVLFVSADEVEAVTINFMQAEGSSVTDSSVTVFVAGDEDMDLASETANIRWAYVIAVDADGTIVRVGQNLVPAAQDTNNTFDDHGILVPAGGFAIVFHCGDGEDTTGSNETKKLNDYFTALLAEAGIDTVSNAVADVSELGWQAADFTTEGGEYDLGSVTLYKGAAPAGEGNEPEEPKEPEIVEVEEVIEVDGDLNDTGWVKAEWLDKGFWQGNEEQYPGDDITGKYAVRADEEKIYIAFEMNTIEPNTLETYNPDVFGQSTASNIRIWFKKDAETRTFFDLQYNGEAFTLANWNTTTEAPSANTEYKVTYADGKLVAEIAVSIEDLGIEDSFYLLVTYSDTFETGYNAIHFTTAETLNNPEEGAANPNYWDIGNTYSYTEYTVEDLLLDSYEDVIDPADPTPSEPDDAYEKELEENVGGTREDPDFKIDLTSSVKDGVLTVVLTLKDIKDGVKMQSLAAELHYDPALLKMTNKINTDKSVECATVLPYGADSTWENLTKVNEETGVISISFVVADDPEQVLDADHNIELTFTFDVAEGAEKVGVYVPTESVEGYYADTNDSYYGDGAFTVSPVKAPQPEDSSDPDGGKEDSDNSGSNKPGDAGILVFAVLGILAVAGAVTVVKVRH